MRSTGSVTIEQFWTTFAGENPKQAVTVFEPVDRTLVGGQRYARSHRVRVSRR